MSLKNVLQEFLKEMDWKDEINHNDDNNTDYISTVLLIGGQNYQLILIADEHAQLLKIVLLSPITIPTHRMKEATFVLNFLNIRVPVGNFATSLDDGTFYYRWEISVEGATAAPQQFRTLLGAATQAFNDTRNSAIGAVAFSKLPVEEIYKEYDEAVKKAHSLKV
jgi:hypothetical protein